LLLIVKKEDVSMFGHKKPTPATWPSKKFMIPAFQEINEEELQTVIGGQTPYQPQIVQPRHVNHLGSQLKDFHRHVQSATPHLLP
jgi:bacteriocin-like protein